MMNPLIIKGNFLEEFLVKFIYLFLIILGIGLNLVVFDKYTLFLNLLPFFLLTIISLSLSLIILNRNQIKLITNKIDYLVVLFVLLFCIFNAFHFYESKIEGGHDQGGYFETALLLSKTGHYYEDYSERPVSLITPGYRIYPDQKTRWHFIPGGPVYFSLFHYLFNLKGFPIALSFSLFLSVSIIYFLCKRIRNWKTGMFFILFFLFSYYTIYFSRATWVENIQLLLTWFYIYLLVYGYQNKNVNYLLYAFLPVSLLMAFRLEAILYVSVYILVFFYFLFLRKGGFKFEKKSLPLIISILIFGLSIIASVVIFDPSAIIFGEQSAIQTILKTIKSPQADIAWGLKEFVPYNEQIFQWVFLSYLFGPHFLLIFILSLLNFLNENKKTKKVILLVSFLILPQFVFLVRPSIQLYIPWAARRFWGVFIPYVFILFALFLTNPRNIAKTENRILFLFLIISILIVSCLPGLSILTLAEGKGILNYEKEIASNFNRSDLVIFWDRQGYENWGPPLYFLFGTNVVFDRAPAFDKEIYALFMKDYENVYIATSRKRNEKLYGYFEDQVKYIKTINSPPLKFLRASTCHTGKFAVQPGIFESYYQIRDLCTKNNPPTEIENYQINLNIYQINSSFKEKFIKENYDPNYQVTQESKNIWH